MKTLEPYIVGGVLKFEIARTVARIEQWIALHTRFASVVSTIHTPPLKAESLLAKSARNHLFALSNLFLVVVLFLPGLVIVKCVCVSSTTIVGRTVTLSLEPAGQERRRTDQITRTKSPPAVTPHSGKQRKLWFFRCPIVIRDQHSHFTGSSSLNYLVSWLPT